MRTIIAGSRGVTDVRVVEQAVRDCGWWPSTILSGAARGVDRLGEQWAGLYGLPVEQYPADWNGPLQRGAGHARNAVMAQHAEALVAVWDGSSPGTRNMIETAQQMGRRVYVHRVAPVAHEKAPSWGAFPPQAAGQGESRAASLPPPPQCSTLCAPDEPCSVTASGACLGVMPLPPPMFPSLALLLPPRPPALENLPAGTQLVAGLGVSTIYPDVDVETYSEAGFVWDAEANKWRALPNAAQGKKGLPVVGAALYTAHPTCELLCLAYDLKDGGGKRFWRPGLPLPLDLWAYIMGGGLLEAHNKGFEQWVWEHVLAPRMGWPRVQAGQWRCSMAKARAHTLPGGLDAIGEVLDLPVKKDPEGKRLLDKFSIPRNPTKLDPRRRILPLWTLEAVEHQLQVYHQGLDPAIPPAKAARMCEAWRKVLMADHEDTLALGRYNVTDIVAESHASSVIPDMTPREVEYWQDDQTINHRGVAIDVPALHACIAVIEQAHEQYNAELHALTGGVVAKASELAVLSAWLRSRGVPVGYGKGSMDDEAIEGLLALTTLPADGRRALEIRAAVGSAAVKKVFSMRNMLSEHRRLHDLYVWHGARTGRPTGSGPQPTNLPKAGPPTLRCGGCKHHHRPDAATCPWCGVPVLPGRKPREWSPEAAEDALTAILTRSLAYVEHVFGDAMAAVCGVLRGLFIAALGHDYISSDFTAIEGVVIACIAGETWRIEAFAAGAPMYLVSAERMFGVTVAEMEAYAEANGQHHPLRHKGKGGELGLGFGGWVNALRQFGVDGTDDELKDTVLKWRAASPAIVEFWGGQFRRVPTDDGYTKLVPELFGLEGRAVRAVMDPGVEYPVMRLDGTPTGISYLVRNDVLYCRLLSGRAIPYHRPRLVQAAESWRGLSLSFETNNTNPKNGPIGWIRMNTYGGRLAENVVQATARDIQMHAIRNLEAASYPIVLHTYDEVVAEVPLGWGSIEELEAHMTNTPAWAAGWPIKAAGGWRGPRYRKG